MPNSSTTARAALSALLSALVFAPAASTAQQPASQPWPGARPEDGQWTMPGKNYSLTRYSGLSASTWGKDAFGGIYPWLHREEGR